MDLFDANFNLTRSCNRIETFPNKGGKLSPKLRIPGHLLFKKKKKKQRKGGAKKKKKTSVEEEEKAE